MGFDFFFRMGSTHAICQDYAIAGEAQGCSYALLSDGCSGVTLPGQPGSPYTDFGARFLTRSAQLRLGQLAAGVFPAEAMIHHAADIARHAELPSTSLDATLLAAVTTADEGVITYQTGDGVVASKARDGALCYRSLSFGNGMPFYLSYLLEPARLERLVDPKKFGKDMSPEMIEAAGTVEVTENLYVPGKGWLSPTRRKERFIEVDHARPLTFDRDEHLVVLLLSDGAESFQRKDGTTVPLEQVLEQLFAFKGFVGQFLTRRCNHFLQRFCVENGWKHTDDFSVAGIHLGDR